MAMSMGRGMDTGMGTGTGMGNPPKKCIPPQKIPHPLGLMGILPNLHPAQPHTSKQNTNKFRVQFQHHCKGHSLEESSGLGVHYAHAHSGKAPNPGRRKKHTLCKNKRMTGL